MTNPDLYTEGVAHGRTLAEVLADAEYLKEPAARGLYAFTLHIIDEDPHDLAGAIRAAVDLYASEQRRAEQAELRRREEQQVAARAKGERHARLQQILAKEPCPSCGAEAGAPCVSASGRPKSAETMHAARRDQTERKEQHS